MIALISAAVLYVINPHPGFNGSPLSTLIYPSMEACYEALEKARVVEPARAEASIILICKPGEREVWE